MSGRAGPVVLALVLLTAVLLAVIGAAPGEDDLRAVADAAGPAGPVAFAGAYALVLLLPVPALAPTVAAGALFGWAEGLLVVLVGALASAAVAFALSRALGRQSARRLSPERFAKVDAFLVEHGFAAVLVLRLVPLVPFGPLSCACGLSSVSTRSYLLATGVGIVPGAAAYVAVGAHGLSPGSPGFLAALLGLVALTVLGSLLVRRMRLQALTP